MRRQIVPRRKRAVRRPDVPDAKYRSRNVARFTNKLMLDGKRSLAERIIYDAFDVIETKQKRPPLIIAGNYISWQENSHSKKLVILVSLLILMLAKPRPLSAFSSTPRKFTAWVRCMKGRRQWTGCPRNRSAALRLRLPRRRVSG